MQCQNIKVKIVGLDIENSFGCQSDYLDFCSNSSSV